MKNVRLILGICLLLVIAAGQMSAGNDSKTGTAGGLEILLPVGARGTAMGGAAASITDGVEAIHWNPAGLAGGWEGANVDAMFSHMNYIATTSMDYAAIGVNLTGFGVVGLSLRSFNFGDISETTADYPDGTGRTFSPKYVTLGMTYARALTDRICVGFTGKYISEGILRTSAAGVALDAGVTYEVGQTSTLRGLRFGVALKNIGPNMQFTGGDLEYQELIPNAAPGAVAVPLSSISQSFELPSSFELGFGYDYRVMDDHRLTVEAQFDNMNFGNDQYRFGGEYSFKDVVFLRAGYVTNNTTGDQYVFGGSFGAGVNLNLGGTMATFDYAYMATHVFDAVSVFSVRLKM